MVTSALWFLCGAVAHKFLCILINYVHALNFITTSTIIVLETISIFWEEVNFLIQLKYIALEDLNVEKEEIKKIKSSDRKVVDVWKRSLIKKIIASYPPRLQRQLPFHDWHSAMKLITEQKKTLDK